MNEIELGATAFWLLTATGLASGVVSLWTFRRWSHPAKLRAAIGRVIAHLFELRLFGDEPVLVLRAQRDLLVANAEVLRQAAIPSLLLFLPFAVVLTAMEGFFGHAPFRPGTPATVTLQYGRAFGARSSLPRLSASAGWEIESPPLRVPAASQISWRVRPTRALSGQLQIIFNGRNIRKSISSLSGLQWLSDTRGGSAVEFLLHPLEMPFSGEDFNSISMQYPRATVLGLNWLVWFSLASIAGALGFAAMRRF